MDAIAGTTTRYYYDDQRVLLETDATGTETDLRYFVYGNYIDEVLVMHDIAGEDDYYYAHDHLYSVTALFDDTGAVAERYEYDAYGKATVYTDMGDWDSGSPSTQAYSAVGNPYTFTGRRLDAMDWDGSQFQLNLMYYRARTYDPETGRFMQRDPLSYIDGMNLYEYVRSNSISNTDPSGLFRFSDLIEVPVRVEDKGKMDCQCSDNFSDRVSFGYSSNLNAATAFSWWMWGGGKTIYYNHRSILAGRVQSAGTIPAATAAVEDEVVSMAKKEAENMRPETCITITPRGNAGIYSFTGWLWPVLGRGEDNSHSRFRYTARCCLEKPCCIKGTNSSVNIKCSVRYSLKDKYTFDDSVVIGRIPGREGRNYWIEVVFYQDFSKQVNVPCK